MSDIKSRAEAFAQSYAKAMSLGASNPPTPTQQIGEALFSHYASTDFIAFNVGQKTMMSDASTEVPRMKWYLDRWLENGVGLDIRLDKLRIEAVSDYGEQGGGSACCFVTWRVHPPADSGIEGWSWENMYAYRLPAAQGGTATGRGYWEFVISDNEYLQLLQRFPKWFG